MTWISVSERLPRKYGSYLAAMDGAYIHIACFVAGEWFLGHVTGAVPVTHWQPLPAPPDQRQIESIQPGDWVTADCWDGPQQVERIDLPPVQPEPIAFLVGGGFWRVSKLRKVEGPK
jgi:hypothetical protein